MEPTIQAPAEQDFPVQNDGIPLVVWPNLTEGIVVSAHYYAETTPPDDYVYIPGTIDYKMQSSIFNILTTYSS